MDDPEALEAELPGWHAWRGVTGLFYARRVKSSPPIVLRAESLDDLYEQVRAHVSERARR
jgi:hypothetical protein